jgi:hypothetical protein
MPVRRVWSYVMQRQRREGMASFNAGPAPADVLFPLFLPLLYQADISFILRVILKVVNCQASKDGQTRRPALRGKSNLKI